MRDRDVVMLSSIDWDFLWQGPQEIATRLAAAGNRVVYVENLGTRSPRAAELRRVSGRIGRWATAIGSQGLKKVSERLFVCSPLVFPPSGRGVRSMLNRRFLLPSVALTIRRAGVTRPIIFTFLPTGPALQVIRRLREPASVVVYYCAADFSALAPDRRGMERSERELLSECDLALAICPELTQRCANGGVEAHTIPYGVNLAAFPPPGTVRCDPPPEFSRLRRPIVGYAGGLHRHVDFALLEEAVRARPEWSWVFAGTMQVPASGLRTLPNVRFTGTIEHGRLHKYLALFDVCIVPYRLTEFTRTVVPVKIIEYLAAGKPVVSTGLPAVLRFAGEHPGSVIAAPSSPSSFLDAIEEALRLPASLEESLRRRAIASECDWSLQLDRITALIETASQKHRQT